jgi:hypothetical protein
MNATDLFREYPETLALYQHIEAAISRIGPAQARAAKSQVSFYRTHPFAATWRPGQYLNSATAPLVLSIYLRHRDNSPRWKEVVEPVAGRFTHHLEVRSNADIDDFVREQLAQAWEEAA